MSDLRLPLTDRNIGALPLADSGQYRARDTDLAGFFVLVGTRRKTFMVQGDLRTDSKRVSIKMKVGDATRLSARDARAKARSLLGDIAGGKDPREPRPPRCRPFAGAVGPLSGQIPTLSEAWERYLVSHLRRKRRSEQTIRNYDDHVNRLLADWLQTPLSELGDDPRRIADRHEAISQAHGPAIANGAMRTLRAVYNHARKTCRALPAENPVFAVDWNPEERRDTAMGVRDLPEWFEQLARIENPVRREFHLLCLLSGSRPEALKMVRLAEIDFRERRLHIPKPKGGEDMAFVIPLSRRMAECVIRAMRFGQVIYPHESRIWLFPTFGGEGHLAEHKENRKKLSHWGNDLRQTYRTIGQVAGISDVDMHLLMNHSLPGINAGYITRAKLMSDHLRQQQEKLSTVIVGAVVGQGRRPSGDLSRWLNATSRRQVDELLTMDPDEVRRRFSARSPMRRLELQAARRDRLELPSDVIDPPSRRLRGARQPSMRSSRVVRP